MHRLAGFLANAGKTTLAPEPAVMVAEVIDTDPLRVTAAALDNRLRAHVVYGTWPDAAAGDTVRIMRDEDGGLVAVAWEAA